MFRIDSVYPVRLVLRCPECFERVVVNRDDWIKAHTFCPKDHVPMTVIACIAGAMINEWIELFPAMSPRPPLQMPMPVGEREPVSVDVDQFATIS